MAIKAPIIHGGAHIPPREAGLITALLAVLWVTQVRYPPLSYPHIGLLQLMVLALLAVMLPLRIYRASHGIFVQPVHPAFLPGLLFVGWVLTRWAMEGFNFTGASDVGTILWMSSYLIVGWCITRLANGTAPDTTQAEGVPAPHKISPVALGVLLAIAAVGLACGIHAAWQYWLGYEQTLQALLQDIGAREPDRTEMGLIHHLKLRRVASIWGDPNTLATFSAVALCAALELVAGVPGRYRQVLRLLGLATIPAVLTSVYYSGSRGGLLDVVLVFVMFGGLLLSGWYRNRRSSRGSSVDVLPLLLGGILALGLTSADGPAFGTETVGRTTGLEQGAAGAIGPTGEVSGWAWRSNTVRERVYYLQVGWKMVQMAPVVGLGPGSVERYFGRLKSPDARETRYLHNWVAQISAELGLIGLVLFSWFLLTIAYVAVRARVWRHPVDRALLAIVTLIVFDALLQVTWNQRELMSTFGLTAGILMARSMSLATRPSRTRYYPALRVAGCLAVAGAFALAETRFLAGKSAKNIALDAMAAGEVEPALRYWARATQWTPNDSEPYAARASMALAADQPSTARLLLDKAIRLNPTSAALRSKRAEVLILLRKPDEAYKSLTNALELYPTHPDYNYQMARLLRDMGRKSEAYSFATNAAQYNYIEPAQPRYDALVAELEGQTSQTQPNE